MNTKIHPLVKFIMALALGFSEWHGAKASTVSGSINQEYYTGTTILNIYYISVTGNDANPGSNTAPFRTFAKAVSVLQPGDMLQVLPGTYTESLKISSSGSVSAPITVIGNGALLDMKEVNSKGIDISGSYINVSGFEVIGATQFGINATGQYDVIENNIIHDTVTENGIGVCGSASSHGSALKVRLGGKNINIRNNIIYNNCGEGIAVTRGVSTIVENNTVYDNYGVNIYVDNSPYTTVRYNSSYCTGTHLRNGVRATGVTLGEESYSGWGAQLHDILVSGNKVTDCYIGISAFKSQVGGTLTNVTITKNNILSGQNRSISVDTLANQNVVISYNGLFKDAYVSPLTGVTIIGNLIGFIAISGHVGLSGVTLSYTDWFPTAVTSKADGSYSMQVPNGWSGAVMPAKTCYSFIPVNHTYSNVNANLTSQDFVPSPLTFTISGNVGIAGATLWYNNNGQKSVTADGNGNYAIIVPCGWRGTVSPYKTGYTFTAVNKTYNNVQGNIIGQNYIAQVCANCADINVALAGNLIGSYTLASGQGLREDYNLNGGPTAIHSTNAFNLTTAERVIYKVNGTNTSYSEMMALPDSQLTTTYWLPWYNNVDLDTQLRIGNVSGTPAQVHVFIAGNEVNGSPFNLSANGNGQSLRLSFPNVNSGPVQIVADQTIVAAERVIYKVNGTNTSFSELMAPPDSQLTTTYWLPWYNNVDLDTQLRIGNVSGTPAQVHVFIAGLEVNGSPFNLSGTGTGQSLRLSFPNVNSGPVQIVADQNIVAAERVIYKVNGTNTSFSELMALPNSQLTTTYWLPWYNNVDLDTQLRIGNVGGTPAQVHVFIAGQEVNGSPFNLSANGTGQSLRLSFPNVNSGPVQIVSSQNIVAAERVIYKVNGTNTSFSELMALPDSQLTTTYWLPWYNNVDLDTQLRFGVP